MVTAPNVTVMNAVIADTLDLESMPVRLLHELSDQSLYSLSDAELQ